MYIRHLGLSDFRSWQAVQIPLEAGATVFIGHNGAGKTNLVEAVGYLSGLSSHRVASDTPLIRRGVDQALIQAAVVNDGRELLVEVEINAGRANRARLNRVPQARVRDVLGAARTVLFAPEDLALVRGDPSDRRRFLDELLVMRAPRLAGVRADYDKVLRQRSTLLKSAGGARRAGSSLTTLDVWDDHLARSGAELVAARLDLLDALAPPAITTYADLAPESAPIGLRYRSSLGEAFDPDERDPDVLAAMLVTRMAELRGAELDRGVCLVGPHRDDVELLLADGPAKGFASQGESWTLALSLKLASVELLRADGVEPILILDDVFAELDAARRIQLAHRAATAEQVLITAAVGTDIPAELAGRRRYVVDGTVVDGPVVDGPVVDGPRGGQQV